MFPCCLQMHSRASLWDRTSFSTAPSTGHRVIRTYLRLSGVTDRGPRRAIRDSAGLASTQLTSFIRTWPDMFPLFSFPVTFCSEYTNLAAQGPQCRLLWSLEWYCTVSTARTARVIWTGSIQNLLDDDEETEGSSTDLIVWEMKQIPPHATDSIILLHTRGALYTCVIHD